MTLGNIFFFLLVMRKGADTISAFCLGFEEASALPYLFLTPLLRHPDVRGR